jgi:hypothetical protein
MVPCRGPRAALRGCSGRVVAAPVGGPGLAMGGGMAAKLLPAHSRCKCSRHHVRLFFSFGARAPQLGSHPLTLSDACGGVSRSDMRRPLHPRVSLPPISAPSGAPAAAAAARSCWQERHRLVWPCADSLSHVAGRHIAYLRRRRPMCNGGCGCIGVCMIGFFVDSTLGHSLARPVYVCPCLRLAALAAVADACVCARCMLMWGCDPSHLTRQGWG